MFVCCDVFTPAKTFIFFTALCPLRFSHKSCGYKEMRCSDFKATRRKRKEYFASWEHLLGQFQSWSGNTTSQIFAAHEHRKCITSRHCRVERTQPAHNLTCCVIHNTNLWGRDDSEDTIIDRDVLFFFQDRTELNPHKNNRQWTERREGEWDEWYCRLLNVLYVVSDVTWTERGDV